MTDVLSNPPPATIEESLARATSYLRDLDHGAPWPPLTDNAAYSDHFATMAAGMIVRQVNDLARQQEFLRQPLCEVDRLTLLAAQLAAALIAERHRVTDLVNRQPLSAILLDTTKIGA